MEKYNMTTMDYNIFDIRGKLLRTVRIPIADIKSGPVEVDTMIERMVWKQRQMILDKHDTFTVRNSYFQENRMDEWQEIKNKIISDTHKVLVVLNKERILERQYIEENIRQREQERMKNRVEKSTQTGIMYKNIITRRSSRLIEKENNN